MAKKKILIIDDDQEFLKLAQAHLKKTNNYEVRVEFGGKVALPVALEFKPDLILLDVVMPEVDGGEVASQIRSDKALKDIPLVFLTSLVRQEETATREKFLDKQNFIEKLADKKELVGFIEGLFRRGVK